MPRYLILSGHFYILPTTLDAVVVYKKCTFYVFVLFYKNKRGDIVFYNAHDGEFEKDFGKLIVQINFQKNLLIADMQLIMREDKV